MDNDKKLNFYFPDNTFSELFIENKPITKGSFLPQQQPLIFDKHKFIYQPVTKVACKTIKTWMLSLTIPDLIAKFGESSFGKGIESSHINDINFNIHDWVGKVFGPVSWGTDDREEAVVIDNIKLLTYNKKYIKVMDGKNVLELEDNLKDYFKFTFVRNPWSRILSAYLEKFRSSAELTYAKAINMNTAFKNYIPEEHFTTYFEDDGILSFEGFVDILYQLSKESYNNFDIHWMPQYIMNDMYIKDYDFIGKLENFENDFDKILETLNIKIKPKYNIGSTSHLFQKYYKFYENKEDLITKVAEIYKEDIERYGYDFSDLERY